MRLLLNAPFHTRVKVGISRYMQKLANSISALSDVTVLTPHPDMYAGTGCRIRSIPGWTCSRPGRLIWTACQTGWHNSGDFEAIITPLPIAPLASRLPSLAVVHDLTPLVLRELHSSYVKSIFWLSLQTLRRADGVVAVSESTRRDLKRLQLLPDERIHVIPEGPGIDVDPRESPDVERLRPFVLYVGGHAPHKNVCRLVQAFSKARLSPGIRLVLVGWGLPQHVVATRTAVQKYGLENQVVFMHDVEDTLLSSLYSQCSAFVYPSLYEGFGLPVLEALAHGAPIACSGTSSLPEVCGDAALLFDPTSVTQMAEMMSTIVNDVDEAARLRCQGPRRARALSWERTAAAMVSLARDIAKSPRAS